MLARLGFGKVALATSVAVHASVTLIAAWHAHPAASASAPLTEVSAPDLLRVEPEDEPPEQEAAHQALSKAVHDNARDTPSHRSFRPSVAAAAVATEVAPVPAPGMLATPVPGPPRFTMLVAATNGLVSSTTALGDRAAAASADAPAPESTVEVAAKLRSGAPPAYTAQALAAGVESDVPLEIVIDPSGVVQSARALGHVGYGLDEVALQSVRNYRFTPAQRRGHAVAVRMRWVMRFQLD